MIRKISIALRQASILVLPVVLLLGLAFDQGLASLLLFLGLGYAFLVYMIVSKYAAYPAEMSLMQLILLALSVMMPLFLIVLIPYFFVRSTKHLNKLLNDKAATTF